MLRNLDVLIFWLYRKALEKTTGKKAKNRFQRRKVKKIVSL